jgi:signal transduction histidine kinase
LFVSASLLVVAELGQWETIPFHLVWLSLTLVFAFRLWDIPTTVVVGVAVMVLSGWALFLAVSRSPLGPGFDELSEIPLMAAMFGAMVWHAHRRQVAVEELGRVAESQRRMLDRQREFVRDAAHQLRTPITIARGHADLLRTELAAGSDQATADLDVVVEELIRLSRLSERLLLLAAADDPRFLTRAPVPVRELVEECAKRWTAAAPREWRVRVLAEGTVPADRERLAMALDALIENAVKYTDEGDPITVTGRSEGTWLALEVTDGGIGILRDQIDHVFERFSRGTPEGGGGGTGLGLPIVRAIAQAHGGSVDVTSEPGRGSTFTIRVPGFRSATDQEASSSTRRSEPSSAEQVDSFV